MNLRPLILLLAPAFAAAQSSRTFINPIDLDYRYNFEQMNEGISYRSGADPVIVPYGDDEYYLFATIAGGYWRSPDLHDWTFVTPTRWPVEDIVAPAARAVGDTIFLLQSMTTPRPIFHTTEPATGRLEFFNRWYPTPPGAQSQWGEQVPGPDSIPPGPWDPDLFHDPDTGRWFMYWGSSNYYPLFGIELDPRNRLLYVDTVVRLFGLNPEQHGWERFGRDHRDPRDPFIEGAWMTKHDGRYYLQYGAPGTEYNVYANGVYVADAPLGPFTYAPYNPIAYKPGGFMTGAGHGNTFRDHHGNYWNTGTGWIGINWNFERRIVMHPAGFDGDGQMYVNTRFGDFPHWLPTGKWQDSDELFTGWMLLSWHKSASASSVRDTFPATQVTDEDPRTFWVAQTAEPGEWLSVDLGREYEVKAVQVNFVDDESDIFVNDSTVYTTFRLEHSRNGNDWQPLATTPGSECGAAPTCERRDRPNAYIELPAPVRTRHVRYVHEHVGAPNLAISDLRVFGNGDGAPPPTPRGMSVRRDDDARNAFVEWEAVPGTVGYNVVWGIAPDKLYQTYQVFADENTTLEV
ncbi:MAG: family 43 glycosylhydrolase, partial [Longimicrobiales bacterium]